MPSSSLSFFRQRPGPATGGLAARSERGSGKETQHREPGGGGVDLARRARASSRACCGVPRVRLKLQRLHDCVDRGTDITRAARCFSQSCFGASGLVRALRSSIVLASSCPLPLPHPRPPHSRPGDGPKPSIHHSYAVWGTPVLNTKHGGGMLGQSVPAKGGTETASHLDGPS